MVKKTLRFGTSRSAIVFSLHTFVPFTGKRLRAGPAMVTKGGLRSCTTSSIGTSPPGKQICFSMLYSSRRFSLEGNLRCFLISQVACTRSGISIHKTAFELRKREGVIIFNMHCVDVLFCSDDNPFSRKTADFLEIASFYRKWAISSSFAERFKSSSWFDRFRETGRTKKTP